MEVTQSQLLNMKAIKILEQQGNSNPTQEEIDEAEKRLLEFYAEFGLIEGNKNQTATFNE